MFSVIADVLSVISWLPLKLTPEILRALARMVALPALPVADAATTFNASINALSTYESILVATRVSV